MPRILRHPPASIPGFFLFQVDGRCGGSATGGGIGRRGSCRAVSRQIVRFERFSFSRPVAHVSHLKKIITGIFFVLLVRSQKGEKPLGWCSRVSRSISLKLIAVFIVRCGRIVLIYSFGIICFRYSRFLFLGSTQILRHNDDELRQLFLSFRPRFLFRHSLLLRECVVATETISATRPW